MATPSTLEIPGVSGRPARARRLIASPSAVPSAGRGHRLRRVGVAYLYLLPSLVGAGLFILVPVIAVVVLGFFSWNLVGSPQYVGLANYHAIFTSSLFWSSLQTTAEYVVLTVVPLVVLSLGLAMLLRNKFMGAGVFRTIAVLPWLATPVAIGVVWEWISTPKTG